MKEIISQALARALNPGPSVRACAHSIRGMATSASFLRNFKVSSILEAASWKSPLVFTSFYFKEIQFSFPGGFGLGPFVAAGSVVGVDGQ